MKKYILVLLALLMLGGGIAARDIEFSVGLEFGIDEFGSAGETMRIMPMIGVGCNFNLTNASSIRLGADVWFETMNLITRSDVETTLIVTPNFKFTHGINGIGDFYALVELNMFVQDPFDMSLGFYLGFNFDFGIGIEVGIEDNYFGLSNNTGASFFNWLHIMPSVFFDPIHAYVEVKLPIMENGFALYGLTLVPGFGIEIPPVPGLMAYFELPVSGIGGDVNVGMTIGVMFSF
ncbi:MAG: hypothetical protein FWC34_00570 [Bacteroidetes bacterium]|nr:hypothetical protein [Bacteroidota bacterium]